MEQNKDTRVIYFSDLFFSVLYAWRKILVVALVFAALLGGVQTVRYMKARNVQPPALSEETLQDIAELEARLDVNQMRIASLEEYLSKSIGMRLNPYQIYQANANIFVEAETPESTAAVIWAYQTCLRSHITTPDVMQSPDIDTEYLSELVSCQIAEGTGNLLAITTTYSDAEGADQLMSDMLSAANGATAQISQDIAPHTIRILSYPTTMKTSQNLQKQQLEYSTTLSTLKADSEVIQKEIDKLNTPPTVRKPANPVIVAIIGAIFGAFIVVCLVIVGHFASDKVYSARTLKNRTGLRVLGRMPAGKCCKIDKWLYKLEKRACEPALASTAANIRNYCNGVNHLLVAGNDAEQVQAVMQIVREHAGMTVTCCGSLLQDVEALQTLPVCDAVLLVETCKTSTYANVDASAQLVADQNKSLIGCLLLGG